MSSFSRDLPDYFVQEWNDATLSLLKEMDDLAKELGMSEEARSYIQSLSAYPRFPYIAALWVPDHDDRMKIGSIICMHAIGLKFLDNILDDDSGLSRLDLALGSPIVDEAYVRLLRYRNGVRAVRRLTCNVAKVWRVELQYVRNPPVNLKAWLDYTETKSGLLMSAWAESACICAEVEPAGAKVFCRAYCILLQFANDAHGYSNGERQGNLIHLFVNGGATRVELDHLLRDLVDEARTSLEIESPAVPVWPLVESAVRRFDVFMQEFNEG
ncbi:hypothetical protein SH528x_003832 [Novipirellula sp. SH528]|uniref:hypothetical protein n=1 Tax=Novipirellula sp. SH528 TaxID=3454466 RepID=UPI003F9FE685